MVDRGDNCPSGIRDAQFPALAIVTLCMDDPVGLGRTLTSTERLRTLYPVTHRVIDGSSIEFRKRAEQVVDSHAGVHYQWIEPNGTSDAINRALEMTAEPWIWFLNSGDEVIREFNPVLLTEILANTNAKVVTFSIENSDGTRSMRPPLPFMWPPVFTWLCIPATIFKTDELKSIGGLDIRFKVANDGEMWFRLLGRRSVTLDVISVSMVRMEPAGMSSDRHAVAREALAFLKKHRYLLFKRWVQGGLRYFEAKRKYRRRLRG